jgi:hypothetical protein
MSSIKYWVLVFALLAPAAAGAASLLDMAYAPGATGYYGWNNPGYSSWYGPGFYDRDDHGYFGGGRYAMYYPSEPGSFHRGSGRYNGGRRFSSARSGRARARVHWGDPLSEIAQDVRSGYRARGLRAPSTAYIQHRIARLNGIRNPDLIYAGEVLRLR